MRYAMTVGFLVTMQGCISQMASIGTFPVLDDKMMGKVNELGDAELTADAKRLPKTPRAGTGEYYASLCFKVYVDARYAEHRLQAAPPADPQQKAQLEGEALGYGSCASTCKSAATEVRSSYSEVAAKYQPRCEQAMAGKMANIHVDALAKSVEAFRAATSPLERYLGARDSEIALQQASAQAPNDARLPKYADEIEALRAQHAGEITKAKAFLESPAAHDNAARRDSLQAEIQSIESDMETIERQQESLNRSGSLDAYMEKRKLDDQLRAKQRVLDAKHRELGLVKAEFDRLATKAGVLRG